MRIEELVEETKDPELEQLAEEMQEAVEELRQPDVDQREALARGFKPHVHCRPAQTRRRTAGRFDL